MPASDWNSTNAREELTRLILPGVLGFYSHFEVTEIFAFSGGAPFNVLSILVAEERLAVSSDKRGMLSAKPIRSKLLSGWGFGVKRYIKPITELVPAFSAFCESGEWQLSGEPLQLSDLAPIPPQFVPADSIGSVPLNRVLKNNFWNGSYVLEWADPKKTIFKPLFERPQILQEVSQAIRKSVPISIDGLSDRLGNVLVQLPVAVIMTRFGQSRASGDFTVDVAWHPRATARPLRVTCENQHDHVISDFSAAPIQTTQAVLPIRGGQGLPRSTVWDDEHRVLLAASGELAFIHSIGLSTHLVRPDTPARVFSFRDQTGATKEMRIPLTGVPDVQTIIGEPKTNPAGDWTQRRIYREDAARLAQEKRFIQYRPSQGQHEIEHEKALDDLRFLIRAHGREGAWLWDPYLGAYEVLDTLFHCPYPDSDLRALTAGYIPPLEPRRSGCLPTMRSAWSALRGKSPQRPVFTDQQKEIFRNVASSHLSLKLEFRIRSGSVGWAFHDRFLIFPATGLGARAWSLGTSVNSLGKQHHILQEAGDGQLIMQAFLDLWNELDRPEHLIWKAP